MSDEPPAQPTITDQLNAITRQLGSLATGFEMLDARVCALQDGDRARRDDGMVTGYRADPKTILCPEQWRFDVMRDELRRHDLITQIKKTVFSKFDRSKCPDGVSNDRVLVEQYGDTLNDAVKDFLVTFSVSPEAEWPSAVVKRTVKNLRFLEIKHEDGVECAFLWRQAINSSELPAEYKAGEEARLRFKHDAAVAKAAAKSQGNRGEGGSGKPGGGGVSQTPSSGGRGGRGRGKKQSQAGKESNPAPDE
eukprot:PhM_4_TR13919/c0_g1_i1/m.40045